MNPEDTLESILGKNMETQDKRQGNVTIRTNAKEKEEVAASISQKASEKSAAISLGYYKELQYLNTL